MIAITSRPGRRFLCPNTRAISEVLTGRMNEQLGKYEYDAQRYTRLRSPFGDVEGVMPKRLWVYA